ncbi:MAG: hypothetical protein WBM07_01875 [Chitinivibrionales bacterium]
MVGFDSIIPPGRVGTVTEEVNTGSLHGGTFSKSATITSNAKNSPTLQISMKGTIKEAVAISPEFIQFNKDKNGKYESIITMTSERANLAIEEIAFKDIQAPSSKLPAWQKDLPIPINFSLVKDTVMQKPDHVYTIKMSLSYGDTVMKTGEFIFKTNHPDAPEVKTNGTIFPGK